MLNIKQVKCERIFITETRTWIIESRSRKVTVCGSFNVSKSTVIPYGIAISSVRAYRRPSHKKKLEIFEKPNKKKISTCSTLFYYFSTHFNMTTMTDRWHCVQLVMN